jgi:SCP-2 sterol transfer family protein
LVGRFKDESDVYAFIGRLFQDLAVDAELAPRFKRANTTVQYRMTDPDSQITIDLRPDRDIHVDLGRTELDPEVVMMAAADTAHEFWLGQVNITAALARGDITAKGPVAKILRLVPLVKDSFPRYEQMLRDAGRTDLLETRSAAR